MRKIDRVLREILHRFYEEGEYFSNQRELAETCGISLGTVNPLVARLERLGAIERKPIGFRLIDPKRALLYWAITRELFKDVIYKTFVPTSIEELEASLQGALFTAYSGFRARYGSGLGYEQVFIYSDADKIERRFRPIAGRCNLFVLARDEHLERLSEGGVACPVQIYVDLWQLGSPAKRFVKELEGKFASREVLALERFAKRPREPRARGVSAKPPRAF